MKETISFDGVICDNCEEARGKVRRIAPDVDVCAGCYREWIK